MSWFRPASGCSSAGSVRNEDTSVAAVEGSKGVGVKESREESSPEGLLSLVGGEVDLRPVRVSHLRCLLVGVIARVNGREAGHRHDCGCGCSCGGWEVGDGWRDGAGAIGAWCGGWIEEIGAELRELFTAKHKVSRWMATGRAVVVNEAVVIIFGGTR